MTSEQQEFQECPQCRKMMVMDKDKRFWKCKCGNEISARQRGTIKREPDLRR